MLESTFLYTAIAGGAVLGLQFLLTFLGGGEDGADLGDGDIDLDVDADFDSDGHHSGSFWFFEMVSLRTLAAAATFFGLVGLTARSYELSASVSLLLACAAGFAAMYSVYWMFKQLFKLQSSGTQRIANAVGLPAQVYLRIPPNNTGTGKVHVNMQQRTVEYLAVTDDADGLASGENAWVVAVVNGDTLRVAREA